jgi:hypothetical protein
VKFNEHELDFAVDAAKEVNCIGNTTGDDDMISDDMRLRADDAKGKEEDAKGSKAAPPVDIQDSNYHDDDIQGQWVDEIKRYPLRNRTQSPAWNLAANAAPTPDSPTVSLALESTDKDKWLDAIDKEVSTLKDSGTWTIVPHQPGMNILRSYMVLKVKRDTAGAIIKNKARLVAGGDAKIHGLDFDKLCAPVADFTVVRVILSIYARVNRVVLSLDVPNRSCVPHWQKS